MENVYTRLKSLKTLSGKLSDFPTEQAPATPQVLFLDWLEDIIDAGAVEPHVMTLSTVDSDGAPDARVVMLLNVDANGWHFAANNDSPKGRQLAAQPLAALTFYWAAKGKQIRLRGKVASLGPEAGAADFLLRPERSRASILAAHQSCALENSAQLESAVALQLARLEREPGLVSPNWTMFALARDEVEFWQSSEQRRFTRLRYQRTGQQWQHQLLWP